MKAITRILFVALLLFCSSCSREEDGLFDKPAAQRVNEAVSKTVSILTSAADGWVMTYYPQSTQEYGGYTFLMKFGNDGTVDVSCELTEDSSYMVSSRYSVCHSAGVTLSFDTYNELFHLFADPSAPLAGIKGSGMEGDNDFLVVSADDEKIVLKGRKSGSYSTLTPMQGSDWASYLTIIHEYSDETSYSKYNLNNGSISVEAYSDYRTLTFRCMDTEGRPYEKKVAYSVTLRGIKLYEPTEIMGITIDEFTYDIQKAVFTSVSDSGVKLVPYLPGLAEIFASGVWSICYSGLSPWAASQFDKADAILKEQEGEELYFALLSPGSVLSSMYTQAWGFTFVSAGVYGGQLGLSMRIVSDDKVSMIFNNSSQGDGAYYLEKLSFRHYLEVFGFDKARTFIISTDNIRQPSWLLLTEEGNNQNSIRLLPGAYRYK